MQSVLRSQLYPRKFSLNISQLRLRMKTGNQVGGRKFWFLIQESRSVFLISTDWNGPRLLIECI